MKRLTEILIFALCIALALTPAVSANSGPSWWEGTTASGLTVTGTQCPILVEQEQLTFELGQFPLEYYEDESAFVDYDGTVTAAYTFRNPTAADVTMELLFPFGVAPQYAPTGRMLPHSYAVTVNGEPVETVLRHSLSWGEFDMAEDAARLQDDFMVHPFYTPELPVTKYIYQPTGVEWGRLDVLRAKLRLDTDPDRTKYILEPGNSYETAQDHALVGSALRRGETVAVYVLGQVPEDPLEWTLYKGGEQIDGTMECVDTEQTTLKELLLSSWSADLGVSEIDWYHAAIDRMLRTECGYGYLEWSHLGDLPQSLMGWYQYELTIPAGGTVVNTVTAPMYPDIHTGWDPPIYSYQYLLSPAKGWSDFGNLDIYVNTPFYMTQCSQEGFGKTDEGYVLHLTGLPEGELEFVLSRDKKPAKPGSHGMGTGLVLAGIGVLLVLGLARRWKKNKFFG